MSNICSICLEELSSNKSDYFNGLCNHAFHGSCIIKHVVKNNIQCPMCRKNLIKEENDVVLDNNTSEIQTPPPVINTIVLPPIIPALPVRPNYTINQSVQRNLEIVFNETLSNLINRDQRISYLV